MRSIKNRVLCNKCLDVIESKHQHDFVWCKCGNCAVDGGLVCRRVIGSDYTDLSEYKNDLEKSFVHNEMVGKLYPYMDEWFVSLQSKYRSHDENIVYSNLDYNKALEFFLGLEEIYLYAR